MVLSSFSILLPGFIACTLIPTWAFFVPTRRHFGQRNQLSIAGAKSEVDVSDLGLTIDDIQKALPSEFFAGLETRGFESTSRNDSDQGCEWAENEAGFEVVLRIPGLRGQPSAAMNLDVTPTTLTVAVFGYAVWSCVLKGQVDSASAVWGVEDGPEMTATIKLSVDKAAGEKRWGGFIGQIGEDSIL